MATNGKSKLIYWLIGIIQILAVGFAGYWMGRIERVEAKVEAHELQASDQWIHFEGRLSKTEANYELILKRLDHIDKSLEK